MRWNIFFFASFSSSFVELRHSTKMVTWTKHIVRSYTSCAICIVSPVTYSFFFHSLSLDWSDSWLNEWTSPENVAASQAGISYTFSLLFLPSLLLAASNRNMRFLLPSETLSKIKAPQFFEELVLFSISEHLRDFRFFLIFPHLPCLGFSNNSIFGGRTYLMGFPPTSDSRKKVGGKQKAREGFVLVPFKDLFIFFDGIRLAGREEVWARQRFWAACFDIYTYLPGCNNSSLSHLDRDMKLLRYILACLQWASWYGWWYIHAWWLCICLALC